MMGLGAAIGIGLLGFSIFAVAAVLGMALIMWVLDHLDP